MKSVKNKAINSLRFIWPPVLLLIYAFCQLFILSKNIWANLVAAIITLAVLGFALKYQKTKPKKFSYPIRQKLLLVVYAIFGIVICLMIYGYIYYLVSNGEIPNSKNQEILQDLAKMSKLRIFIETVLMGPIFEETIFRLGLISFKNKQWTIGTSIFSIICFAAMHMIGTFNLWVIIPYLIISVFLTLLYVYTKDMKCNILLHILYNLIASVNLL